MRQKRTLSFEQLSNIYAFLAQTVSMEHDYSKLVALKSALDFDLIVMAAKLMILEKVSVSPSKPEYGDGIVGFRIAPLYSQLFMFTSDEVDTALNQLIMRKKIRLRYDQPNGAIGILRATKAKKKAE